MTPERLDVLRRYADRNDLTELRALLDELERLQHENLQLQTENALLKSCTREEMIAEAIAPYGART